MSYIKLFLTPEFHYHKHFDWVCTIKKHYRFCTKLVCFQANVLVTNNKRAQAYYKLCTFNINYKSVNEVFIVVEILVWKEVFITLQLILMHQITWNVKCLRILLTVINFMSILFVVYGHNEINWCKIIITVKNVVFYTLRLILLQ